MTSFDKLIMTFVICVAFVFTACILGAQVATVNDRNNMAKNIESAIQKGVDPVSVKCAYETHADSICIAYSLGKR